MKDKQERIAEECMDGSDLPNVVILTDGPVSPSHGTGAILMRHFANYDSQRILNVYWLNDDLHGEPTFRNSLHVDVWGSREPVATRVLRRVRSLLSPTGFLPNGGKPPSLRRVPSIRPRIERVGFLPDIIYATCFTVHSVRMLARLISEYDASLPIVQHFFDYMPKQYEPLLEQELREIAPRLTRIWALSRSIADHVSPILGSEVKIVGIFCDDIPRQYKREHAAFGPDFTATILGNIWRPQVLNDILDAWCWAGEKLGGLPPIQWICHPRSVAEVEKLGVPLGPGIQHVGFLPRAEMYERLQKSDIAIIPFNRERYPETDYARYSLPSRITEIAAAGLPIFLAGSPHTETAQYIEEHGIGLVAVPSDRQQFRNSLVAFIKDRQLRAECGRRARALAEREFDINKYQAFLYGELRNLAERAKS